MHPASVGLPRHLFTIALLFVALSLAPASAVDIGCGNLAAPTASGCNGLKYGITVDHNGDGAVSTATDECILESGTTPPVVAIVIYNDDDDNKNKKPDYKDPKGAWDNELFPIVIEKKTGAWFCLEYDESVLTIYDEHYHKVPSTPHKPYHWEDASFIRRFWGEVSGTKLFTGPTMVSADPVVVTKDTDAPCGYGGPTETSIWVLYDVDGGPAAKQSYIHFECFADESVRPAHFDLDVDSQNNGPDSFECEDFSDYSHHVRRYVAEDAVEVVTGGTGLLIPTNDDDDDENGELDLFEPVRINPYIATPDAAMADTPPCTPTLDSDYKPMVVDLGPWPVLRERRWSLDFNEDKIHIYYHDWQRGHFKRIPSRRWELGYPDPEPWGIEHGTDGWCAPVVFTVWIEGLEATSIGAETVKLRIDYNNDSVPDYIDEIQYTVVYGNWATMGNGPNDVVPVDETRVAISRPRPGIELDVVRPEDVRLIPPSAGSDRGARTPAPTLEVTISGEVTDVLADMVKIGADLDVVRFYHTAVSDENLLAEVELDQTHAAGKSSFWRPYPYRGDIPPTTVQVPADENTTILVATGANEVGEIGIDGVSIEVEARIDIERSTPPTSVTFLIKLLDGLDPFLVDEIQYADTLSGLVPARETGPDTQVFLTADGTEIELVEFDGLTSVEDALTAEIHWSFSGTAGQVEGDFLEMGPLSGVFAYHATGTELHSVYHNLCPIGGFDRSRIDVMKYYDGPGAPSLDDVLLVETAPDSGAFQSPDGEIAFTLLEDLVLTRDVDSLAGTLRTPVSQLRVDWTAGGFVETGPLSMVFRYEEVKSPLYRFDMKPPVYSVKGITQLESSERGHWMPLTYRMSRPMPTRARIEIPGIGPLPTIVPDRGLYAYPRFTDAATGAHPLIGFLSPQAGPRGNEVQGTFFMFRNGPRWGALDVTGKKLQAKVIFTPDAEVIETAKKSVEVTFLSPDGPTTASLSVPLVTLQAIARGEVVPEDLGSLLDEKMGSTFHISVKNLPENAVCTLSSAEGQEGFQLVWPGDDVGPTLTRFAEWTGSSDVISREKVIVYHSYGLEPGEPTTLTDSEWVALKDLGYLAIHNQELRFDVELRGSPPFTIANIIGGSKDHHVFPSFGQSGDVLELYKNLFDDTQFHPDYFCVPTNPHSYNHWHREYNSAIKQRLLEFEAEFAAATTKEMQEAVRKRHFNALMDFIHDEADTRYDLAKMHTYRERAAGRVDELGSGYGRLLDYDAKINGTMDLRRLTPDDPVHGRKTRVIMRIVRLNGSRLVKGVSVVSRYLAPALLIAAATGAIPADVYAAGVLGVDRSVAANLLAGRFSFKMHWLGGQDVDCAQLKDETVLRVGQAIKHWTYPKGGDPFKDAQDTHVDRIVSITTTSKEGVVILGLCRTEQLCAKVWSDIVWVYVGVMVVPHSVETGSVFHGVSVHD